MDQADHRAPFARPRPLAAGFALALLAGLGVGCSSYQPPRFTLEEVRRSEPGPDGTVLEFTILAENRNDRPLPLRQANYDLVIDGRRVFSGVRSPEATIRRYGAQRFTLPAVAPVGALPEGATFQAGLEGSVEYLTPGALAEVLFDTGVRRPDAPLRLAATLAPGAGVVYDAPDQPPVPDALPEPEPAPQPEPAAEPAPDVEPLPEPLPQRDGAGPGRWDRR